MLLSFAATKLTSAPVPDLDWVETETSGLALGDVRLQRRQRRLLARLFTQCRQSIPGACQGAAEVKAAYRFLEHPKVTVSKVLTPHLQATAERARQHPVVLAVQDTTSLDFTDKAVGAALGPLEAANHRGLFLHATLAVTPDRVCLGLLAVELRVRPEARPPDAPPPRAFTEKESVRWRDSYQAACRLAAAAPQTQVVSVADREGDIFELYQAVADQGTAPHAEYVVRAAQDRRATTRDADGAAVVTKIWAAAAAMPVSGEVRYTLAKTATRTARAVTQTLQAGTVTLPPPTRTAGAGALTPVTVQLVLVREVAPPPGEAPLEWLLVTTLPVDTPAAARRVVEYYLCRWEVELYFKVLKSGCQVERLYLSTPERLRTCLALYLIIAWRVLYVARLGFACPELPCTVLFETVEWQAVVVMATRQPPPDTPPTLGELVRTIAGFGSFVGRTGDGPPGITSLWIGLQRAMDFAQAYETFGPGTPLAARLTAPKR
jgi:hypothetical protein